MPTLIASQDPPTSGALVLSAIDHSDGNEFSNTGLEQVVVKNTSGAQIQARLVKKGAPGVDAVYENLDIACDDGETVVSGLLNRLRFNDPDSGRAEIQWLDAGGSPLGSGSGVSVAIVKVA